MHRFDLRIEPGQLWILERGNFSIEHLLSGIQCRLALGKLGQVLLGQIYPNIPFTAPWWAVLAAPLTAIATSILFSVVPARRAARLDPVQALSKR